MFDLPGELPGTFDELRRDLERSVRSRIDLPTGDAVAVEGDAWPDGRRLAVGVTGGVVRVDPTTGGLPEHLRPPTLDRDRTAGPRFADFAVEARPLNVDVDGGGRLPLTIAVDGRDMAFDFGVSNDGRRVMAPSGGEARAELSVPRADLLNVVERVAKSEAAGRGVTIDAVEAEVSSPSPRVLSVVGAMSGAKKVAFFNASFRVRFRAELVAEADANGELIGRVAVLKLDGDGPVMNLVLSLAGPAIEKVRRTPLPLRDILATAGVQGLRVRDVAVTAGDVLTLRAEFGGS